MPTKWKTFQWLILQMERRLLEQVRLNMLAAETDLTVPEPPTEPRAASAGIKRSPRMEDRYFFQLPAPESDSRRRPLRTQASSRTRQRR